MHLANKFCRGREVRPSGGALMPKGSSDGRRADSVRFTVAELRSAPGVYSILVDGKANATDYELIVEMRRAAQGLAADDRAAMQQARLPAVHPLPSAESVPGETRVVCGLGEGVD